MFFLLPFVSGYSLTALSSPSLLPTPSFPVFFVCASILFTFFFDSLQDHKVALSFYFSRSLTVDPIVKNKTLTRQLVFSFRILMLCHTSKPVSIMYGWRNPLVFEKKRSFPTQRPVYSLFTFTHRPWCRCFDSTECLCGSFILLLFRDRDPEKGRTKAYLFLLEAFFPFRSPAAAKSHSIKK